MLGGGHVGKYAVRLFRINKGTSIPEPSNANSFSYYIKVINVTPKIGSRLGGTELTITGENFCDGNIKDNNIFLEFDRDNNVMCTVISATKTEIKCLTPPENPKFTSEALLTVTVQGKLVETAECANASDC